MTLTAPDDRSRATRIASVIALLLAIAYFAARGPLRPGGARLWDYAVCVASASLWVDGQNPYDPAAGVARWNAIGPVPFVMADVGWLAPIVAPTTLVTLAPFAILPATLGAAAYFAVSAALAAAAIVCCGRWAGLRDATAWRFYVAAALANVPITLGLKSGNPAVAAIALAILGCYRSRDRDDAWGGVMLGLSTAAKVQIGGPILIVLWLIGRRRTATVAAAVFAAIAFVAVGRLAGVEWWPTWTTQLADVSRAGGKNDYAATSNVFDLVNLHAPLWQLMRNRRATEIAAAAIWVTLAVIAFVRLRRPSTTPLQSFAIAGPLLLLPIYHRVYDGLILLPIVAIATAMIGRRSSIVAWLAILPFAIPAIAFHANYDRTWLFQAMLAHPLLGSTIGGAPTWGAVALLIWSLRIDNFRAIRNENA